MKNVFFILFLFVSFGLNAQNPNCEIKGKILQNNVKTIFLQSMIDMQNLDSCQVKDNSFDFRFFSEKNDIFRLFAYPNQDMIIMTNPNENILVEFDAMYPQNSPIKGSIESENIGQFSKILTQLDEKQNKLIKKINKQREKQISKLISNSPEKLSNLLFLYMLDYENFADIYQKVKNNLEDKNHSLSQEFFRKMSGYENQTLGKEMIDFSGLNFNGDTIKLSNYKGRMIILNFVASYNHQSMKKLEDLNNFLDMHCDQNSTIVVVNFFLDESENEFKKYCQLLNNSHMVNISDFKSFNSPIVKALNIEQIPFRLIIDENFRISNKNNIF